VVGLNVPQEADGVHDQFTLPAIGSFATVAVMGVWLLTVRELPTVLKVTVIGGGGGVLLLLLHPVRAAKRASAMTRSVD
jgi:hypothetical protein